MARLRLTIRGQPGQISINSFITVIKESLAILRELDRAVSHEQLGTLRWVVSDLGLGSTYVEAESRVIRGDEDFGPRVHQYFVNGVSQVEREAITPALFSVDSIKNIRKIVRSFGKDGVDSLLISLPEVNKETSLTHESEKNLQALVGVHHKSSGAVEGRLELVSLHRPYRRFNVYHAITQRAIKCNLPEYLEEQVIKSLGRRVIASGTVSYNIKGEPLSVQVDNLRTLRKEEDLPSIEDILGMAPDFTDDLSTEDFLETLRNG